MSDPQDRAEQLDDDKMAVSDTPVEDLDYPPERPLGGDDYGTTPVEEQVDEPLAERVAREVPEDARPDDGRTRLVDPTDDEVGAPDDEPDAVARSVEGVPDPSAEEAAVHETAPPPMGDGDDYVEGEPRPGGGSEAAD